jgi:hypothetical protein
MKVGIFVTGLAAALLANAYADEWKPITDADQLKAFMISSTLTREEGGEQIRGTYNEDGVGILYAWGAEFSRTWKIDGDVIEVDADRTTARFRLEASASDPDMYRAVDASTGAAYIIRKEAGVAVAEGSVAAGSKSGGPGAASSSEIAAELANPNSALASMTFKNQFKSYAGDLPDADDQFSYTLLWQPVLPFPLENGDKIIWRPALPLNIEQPVFNGTDFDGETGLGDFAFDLIYAKNFSSGWMTAAGVFTSLPTGTEASMTSGHWTLGPEIYLGWMNKKAVIGALGNHAWDVVGWRDNRVSASTVSAFAIYLPGSGWNVGTAPIMSYDWVNDQALIPVNLTVGKTIIAKSGRPWKYALEVNYYVERADTFGPELMIGLNITPVTVNKLAGLFN